MFVIKKSILVLIMKKKFSALTLLLIATAIIFTIMIRILTGYYELWRTLAIIFSFIGVVLLDFLFVFHLGKKSPICKLNRVSSVYNSIHFL